MIYRKLVRPMVFKLTKDDPEIAHEWAIKTLQIIGSNKLMREAAKKIFTVTSDRLDQKVFGLLFPNPVGLAAGFDKNGEALYGLAALGFGFLEIGTVTLDAQKGNPRPRMFRRPEDLALINRMGFNNKGAEEMMKALYFARYVETPLGISIGKLKATPIETASTEYAASFLALHRCGNYFVVNVSSPNTPNLRALQEKDRLRQIIAAMKRVDEEVAHHKIDKRKPILVKIAPDLSRGAIDDVLNICLAEKVDGIIAVNTTIGREGLRMPTTESGGLSGKPLWPRSLEIVRYIYEKTHGQLPIIGVGGISTPEYAYEMLKAGASLIQILTSLVYEGPFVARSINRGLTRIFKKEGIGHISEISRQAYAGREIKRCSVMRQRGCQPVN